MTDRLVRISHILSDYASVNIITDEQVNRSP